MNQRVELLFADAAAAVGLVIDGFDTTGRGRPDASYAGAVLACNPVQAPGTTPGIARSAAPSARPA